MSITIKDISKRFGDFTALDHVSFNINSGELIALVGPSGSGKTTLLRLIAGLEFPDAGNVYINGNDISKKQPRERNVGFVFQQYALFRHMTVHDNVAFGLKILPKPVRPSKEAITKKVQDLLKLLHIEHLYDRYPSQLSGGQKQRVAIARALAVEPKILLLDEPFGALDTKVRKELRSWMRKLHNEVPITSIFVTHDQEEAMEVADRIVIMNHGHIEQIGSPDEVYNKPANEFVYNFLGNFNLFDGWKDETGMIHLSSLKIPSYINKMKVSPGEWLAGRFANLFKWLKPKQLVTADSQEVDMHESSERKHIRVFARPHHMELTRAPANNGYIAAKVVHINPVGSFVKIELMSNNGNMIYVEMMQEVFDNLNLSKDMEVFIRPKEITIFE